MVFVIDSPQAPELPAADVEAAPATEELLRHVDRLAGLGLPAGIGESRQHDGARFLLLDGEAAVSALVREPHLLGEVRVIADLESRGGLALLGEIDRPGLGRPPLDHLHHLQIASE